MHQGLSKSEVSPVPQTGHNGQSLHLTPTCEAFQIAVAHRQLKPREHMGLEQSITRASSTETGRAIGTLGARRTACRGGLGKV